MIVKTLCENADTTENKIPGIPEFWLLSLWIKLPKQLK